ncbi:hypothetical protein BH23PLA1_BH23PLA1_27720 [soil metagenome]
MKVDERSILSVTSRYSFSLARGSEDKPYTLREFVRSQDEGSEIEFAVKQYLFAPCGIEQYLLSDLMAEPNFRFLDATEVEEEGRTMIKVEFESPDESSYLHSGWFIVSPSDSWTIRRYECFFHPSRKRPFLGTIEYFPGEGGVPLPKRIVCLEPSGLRRECEFGGIKPGPSRESEFTLTHYGLPEIDTPAVRSRTIPTAYWFFLLAVACLIGALALRHLSARYQVDRKPS